MPQGDMRVSVRAAVVTPAREVLLIQARRPALCWWPLAELLETTAPVHPSGLAQRLRRFLDHGEAKPKL